MNQNTKHPNLQTVFHCIGAGITALFSPFLVIHLVMGLGFVCVGHSQVQAGMTNLPQTYEVQSGDTLLKIARRHGVTAKAIMASNDLPDAKIKIGQKLIIPPVSKSVAVPPAVCLSNRPPDVPPLANEPGPHTWLQSATHQVELGVCDKFGNGDFPARFMVTGPDEVVHQASPEITDQKRKSGQENYAAAYVHFPADFNTWWQEGDYSWQCRVETNGVASGAFEYHCRSNTCVVIIKNQ